MAKKPKKIKGKKVSKKQVDGVYITKEEQGVLDYISDYNPNTCYPTGFASCIIGIAFQFGQEPAICLDEEKVIKLLMKRDGMTREEAIEFYDYNILGYGTDSQTLPIFLKLIEQ